MRRIPLILTILALFASLPAKAASPRDTLVVSVSWLAQHLKDPGLVLLHVSDAANYAEGHIEGARHVSLQDISVSDRTGGGNGLTLELPAAEVLKEKLEAVGISDNSRVVVYFGNAPLQSATRVIFTLDYAGLGEHVSLLDGGQAAWVSAGQPLSQVVPESRPGRLSPLKIRPLVATKEEVKSSAGTAGRAIVDARHEEFYSGARPGGGMQTPHRAGHIQGALSLPFTDLTDARLMLRSSEELAARFTKAGVKAGDTVIAYCHLGQQATAVVFAARTLGYKVLLYDGSFEDWTRYSEYPVVKP